jgi:GAF domain-containing protein
VAEPRGRQLFDTIADYLGVAIQALQAYQREQPARRQRTLH